MTKVPELFGSKVFNDRVMRERLPGTTYKALKKTIENGEPLDISVANVVANAMKDWAVEQGCTHFTHWFQPMRARNLSKASPTRRLSQAAASALHMKRAATQPGTPPLPHL